VDPILICRIGCGILITSTALLVLRHVPVVLRSGVALPLDVGANTTGGPWDWLPGMFGSAASSVTGLPFFGPGQFFGPGGPLFGPGGPLSSNPTVPDAGDVAATAGVIGAGALNVSADAAAAATGFTWGAAAAGTTATAAGAVGATLGPAGMFATGVAIGGSDWFDGVVKTIGSTF